MENKNDESFSYTYSAMDLNEVERIRKKYTDKGTDKMEQLRRLDASVGKKATVWSLMLGIIGALILGIGMCCCMIWSVEMFIPGIIIGIVGIIILALAYPIYKRIVKAERKKIAPEIIRLTDELMK